MIRVPHTPDVLTEETAETMRQFPAAVPGGRPLAALERLSGRQC